MALELEIKVIVETPDEARAQLTDLMNQPLVSTNGDSTGAVAAVTEPADLAIARRKIDMVWSRVGDNIKKLLRTAAGFQNGYQTQELAKAMRVTPVQLRSYAANLGRTVKRVNAAVGDDGPIYYWDDAAGRWVMPEGIRQAILAKAK